MAVNTGSQRRGMVERKRLILYEGSLSVSVLGFFSYVEKRYAHLEEACLENTVADEMDIPTSYKSH